MAAGLDPVAGLAAGVGSERPKPARCGPAAIRLDHTVTVGSAIRDIERRLVAAPVRSASIKAAYCPTVESSGSPSRAQFVFEIRQGGPRAARKPGSVPLRAVTICLRRRLPGASSDRYPRTEASSLKRPPIWSCSGGGLPGRAVTGPPVGSYPTFSPLPGGVSPEINAEPAVIFCGTFLRVAPTGGYPAPCSVEPGLSSNRIQLPPAVTCPPRPGVSLPTPLGFLNLGVHRPLSHPVCPFLSFPPPLLALLAR